MIARRRCNRITALRNFRKELARLALISHSG
jgi:hypothetical protein